MYVIYPIAYSIAYTFTTCLRKWRAKRNRIVKLAIRPTQLHNLPQLFYCNGNRPRLLNRHTLCRMWVASNCEILLDSGEYITIYKYKSQILENFMFPISIQWNQNQVGTNFKSTYFEMWQIFLLNDVMAYYNLLFELHYNENLYPLFFTQYLYIVLESYKSHTCRYCKQVYLLHHGQLC